MTAVKFLSIKFVEIYYFAKCDCYLVLLNQLLQQLSHEINYVYKVLS